MAAFNATRAFLADARGVTFSLHLDGRLAGQNRYIWQAYDPTHKLMALRGVLTGRDEYYNGSFIQVVEPGRPPVVLRSDAVEGAMHARYAERMDAWSALGGDLHDLLHRPFDDFASTCIMDAGNLEVRFQAGNATGPQYRFFVAGLDGRLRSAVIRNQTADDDYSAAFTYSGFRIQLDAAAQRLPGRLGVAEASGDLATGLRFTAGANTTTLRLDPLLRFQVIEGTRIVNDTQLKPGKTLLVEGGELDFSDADGDGRLSPGDRFRIQLPAPYSFLLLDAWAGRPLES